MLDIKNLTVKADNKIILKDFNLKINDNEICAIMGSNGAGKSTICKTILNHPSYKILEGTIIYNDEDITLFSTTQRAQNGIFLLNQTPTAVKGVKNSEILRMALSSKSKETLDILSFHKKLKSICKKLDIPSDFIHREANYGMSGGERKKNELLHLWMLEPNFIILDEIDSGLDVDAFKTVMNSIKEYYEVFHPSILIITHNTKVFDYLKPDTIHILDNKKIIYSGANEVINIINNQGFEAFRVGNKKDDE